MFFVHTSRHRIPYDTRQPVSFGVALLVEWLFIQIFLVISIVYLIVYVGFCSNFRTCTVDLTAIVQHPDVPIEQRILMKEKFVQFVVLHKHLYTYF